MKKLNLLKAFRFGGELIHAGEYRVPQDISMDAAERAVRDSLGEWMTVPEKAPAKRQLTGGRGSKGGAKSAGGAPENKAVGGAGATAGTFPTAGSEPKLD